MMNESVDIHPIGLVRSDAAGFRIEVAQPFRPGLTALEGFSHVLVLWWAHKSDTPERRAVLQCRKPYRKGPDVIGVFATRSEYRPNPVAVSVASVLGVDSAAGTIRLAWIDAMDGTPVIDIKPYQPCADRVRKVSVPEWCAEWPKYVEDTAEFDWGAVFNFPQ
jgi:tRNA-Thr(GGU) m(6)t(6)A37 methyltransferase TsaA